MDRNHETKIFVMQLHPDPVYPKPIKSVAVWRSTFILKFLRHNAQTKYHPYPNGTLAKMNTAPPKREV